MNNYSYWSTLEKKCQVCLTEANQKCGGCHIVYYCSRDHQKADWKEHKSFCKTFMIKEDATLGRHLIASRDIKVGEIILREEPLIRGPSQVTSPVCLGCLKFISPETSKECPECGWPTCKHEDCYLSTQHQPECKWTNLKRKNRVRITQFISPHPSYESITPLRICYQRNANPQLWNKLITLESHCDARKNTPKQIADKKSVADFLHRFYNLQDDFSTEEILKICGILEVNGHEVPITEPPYVAVYNIASMLEHSCQPNCSKSFTCDGSIVIHAAVPIKRGDHLSICYTDGLWSTGSRRQHLLETKYFSCRCQRCLDPTEFNTYFSAIKCDKKECEGAVLPPSFCDGETVAWSCHRCGTKKNWSDISDMLDKIGWEMDRLNRNDILMCKQFLEKWKDVLLPNHFYITEIALIVAQQIDQINGIASLTDDELNYKIKLCKSLTDLFMVIIPGECRVRGVLWYELHTATAEMARRNSALGSPVMLTHQLLRESKGYLEKSIFCLQHEPNVMPEGKLLLEAKKTLIQLESALQSVQIPIKL
ncbi:SET and MYND domain containing, arthropod-specific, member 1 isoform X2 [Lycorma delicatula]|uniref:SET and MYND domain containing, arthropod-specific, member 1 isoform X2 n=1 Tax=Lycorma delicatula TaxID=130591 RepID=UPI003F50F633